jgi:uncharacterized protein (UPF0218 family)
MTDRKNILILCLSGSAVLLMGLLIALNASQSRAAVTVTAGDYTAASFAVAGTREYIAVVDNPTKRMIVYRLETTRKRIDVVDARDLGKDMK